MLLKCFVKCIACLAVVGVVGCVPYQTYQQTKAELEKAKEANIDLTKKYNEAMMKLLGRQKEGVPDSELEAKLARLQRENDELRNRAPVQPSFTDQEIKDLGVSSEDGGLYLGEDLLFSEGSATLKQSAFPTLDRIISLLTTKYRDDVVVIEGHTDNQPLKRTKERWKFNMRLGYERAHSVFEYFIDHGVPEKRMVLRTYSMNKPTDPTTVDTEEGRTKNRRVVVRRGGTQI